MKVRTNRGLRSRKEAFGGVVYVPQRDDFFILDRRASKFIESCTDAWVTPSDEEDAIVRTLVGLGILERRPKVATQHYSGVHIIGDVPDLPTVKQPLLVNCFTTFRCPLACRYCLAADLMAEKVEQEDQGQVSKVGIVAETVRKLGCLVAVITGGEPLYRPD